MSKLFLRLNVKHYIKNKPNLWGIKIFALCGKSGLLYDFIFGNSIDGRREVNTLVGPVSI